MRCLQFFYFFVETPQFHLGYFSTTLWYNEHLGCNSILVVVVGHPLEETERSKEVCRLLFKHLTLMSTNKGFKKEDRLRPVYPVAH